MRTGTARQMTQARDLSEAGWSASEIKRILELPFSARTIQRWVNPDLERADYERHRLYESKRRALTANYRWPGHRSDAWLIGRMRVLRNVGVSFASIAKIMAHDHRLPSLTEDQIRYAVRAGRLPREARAT